MVKPIAGIVLPLGLVLSALAGCSNGWLLVDAHVDGPADAAPQDSGLMLMTDGLGPYDLRHPPDLRGIPDLRVSPDLRPPPDLAARPDLSAAPDLASGNLVVRILANNDCTFTVTPPSYGVPLGTTFKVTWENLAASEAPVDIDKDGNVPIIMGLDPGMNYDDMDHPWCGIFTGTFTFEILSCGGLGEYDLQVNCNQ